MTKGIVKKVILAACAIAIIIIGYACYAKFFKKSTTEMVSISQSIEEMKKISEFCTANYFQGVMVMDSMPGVLWGYNKIVMTANGQIRAGFDLSQMETESVGDTLKITLQPAKILDTIVNPSGFKTITESGSWSHQRTTKLKNKARGEIAKLAVNDGVLTAAKENGIKLLTAMFSSFGFDNVEITVNQTQ